MMRVVSRWNRWSKCHSYNWVRQNWRDYCVVDGGEPGVDSRAKRRTPVVATPRRRPVLASHHYSLLLLLLLTERYTSCLVGALSVSRRIKPAPSVAIRQCTLQTNHRRHWTFYLSLSLSLSLSL